MKTLTWTNKWLQQPESFYQRVKPTPLIQPYFVHCNEKAANILGLSAEQLNNKAALRYFSGDEVLPGIEPIATVYAGHQFGIFTSKLGDGRAVLLGETQGTDGAKYEIQLKGAGLTPFSRSLDGRYALSPAIQEYLVGEALTALGIASTRSLCLLGSNSAIGRENEDTGAVLVRMARSHIRFGHFEYFHHRDDLDGVKTLFAFVIEQHFPELLNQSIEQRPMLFLETVVKRTARLIADWQSAGFTHGVMNTDNMAVSGETLDLSSCGFMEAYHPGFSPNPADDQGRYQFDQQPDIGRWNCLALAQALSSLLPSPAIPAGLLRLYRQSYQQHYLQKMRAKLGLHIQHSTDIDLINSLLSVLTLTGLDYAVFFRCLSSFEPGCKSRDIFEHSANPVLLQSWLDDYQNRLSLETTRASMRGEGMERVNPCYILRRYWLDKAIQFAEQDDFTELGRLMTLLQNPYEQQSGMDRYSRPQFEEPEPVMQKVNSR